MMLNSTTFVRRYAMSSSFYRGPRAHLRNLLKGVSSGYSEVTRAPFRLSFFSSDSDNKSGPDDLLLKEIQAMKVRDIQGELASLRVSTVGVLEKEELVRRLVRARRRQDSGGAGVIEAPLKLVSLGHPTRPPYPAVELPVVVPTSSGGAETTHTMTFLLDTAVSNVLVRPETLDEYNLPVLPKHVSVRDLGSGGSQRIQMTELTFRLGGRNHWSIGCGVQ